MAAVFKISVIHFALTMATILLSFEASFILAQSAASGILVAEEKLALVEIARDLGKTDWDFSLNPCDRNNSSWYTEDATEISMNRVDCDCVSFPECHVMGIRLTGQQNLGGVLPPSISKLRYLKLIDLSGCDLSGTIPPEWGSLNRLLFVWLEINRISGPIPKSFGNLTQLITLNMQANQLNGTIPAELGKLVNLDNLHLEINNLTGKLPPQLNNLTKLTELYLSNNKFTGKIPSFEGLISLKILMMQGSGFEGPLPPTISHLTNLTQLKISDLNGGGASAFPDLENMKLEKLELRSCYISGTIPEYFSEMLTLEYLDLSFNKLEGEIPNLDNLPTLEAVYLTSNAFTGPVPDWMKDNSYDIFDLSYNNFEEISVPSTCRETLNLFRSFRRENTSQLGNCLTPCPRKDYYSFHVNCGGQDIQMGDTFFEADEDSSGPAKFVPNPVKNWGTSSTGSFQDTHIKLRDYVAHNTSILGMNISNLYMTARLSPLSLTYYGRCLANGNYTVTLHFMEIILREKQSFQSFGRRVFDVYIQGEKMLKDFDIEQEANGVDIAVKKSFKVSVTDKTLEIRFKFSGKGSTITTPSQGRNGPLVSAISVEADFKPPEKGKKQMLIEASVSLMVLFLVVGFISFYWWNRHIKRKIAREKELRGLDLRTGFTYRQIKSATNNFDAENRIGKGGSGYVYKGTLLDDTVIAVKQLCPKSNQGNRDFLNEIAVISALRHPNLVRLYGCCIEESQLLLVYEYMKNNSLARVLFGPQEFRLELDWPTRQNICLGIAKGLVFMHEESMLKIVHRDIKADNVLLDEDLNPKISDFGLAKLDEEENTHISTKRVAGTTGYMAPEYALWGYLSFKADVYSFGVVALEIVAGKCNMKYRNNEHFVCLLDRALVLQKRGCLMDLVDPKLGSDFNKDEVEKVIRIALMCTSPSPALRPTMSEVVTLLHNDFSLHEFNMSTIIHDNELSLQKLRQNYEETFDDSAEHSVDSC